MRGDARRCLGTAQHRGRPYHRNLLRDIEQHLDGARASRKWPPPRHFGACALLHAYLHGEFDLLLGIPLFSELEIGCDSLHARLTLLLRQRRHSGQLGLEHLA